MDNGTVTRTKATKELTIFILYLFLLFVAEMVTSFVNPAYGLFIHCFLLISLLGLATFWQKSDYVSNPFLCLSLAPLIRVFSLSLPLEFLPSYSWYLVAGIPMLIAAISVIKLQGLCLKDIGITFKKPWLQITIAFTGIPLGIIEYYIIKPTIITANVTFLGFVGLAFAFIVATGFAEELLFRGVFQNNTIKAFGTNIGLIVVAVVFAILHVGWLQVIDIVFVFFVGLFFGLLAFKTGSIIGVSLSHGLTNVFLFLVMPSTGTLIYSLVLK